MKRFADQKIENGEATQDATQDVCHRGPDFRSPFHFAPPMMKVLQMPYPASGPRQRNHERSTLGPVPIHGTLERGPKGGHAGHAWYSLTHPRVASTRLLQFRGESGQVYNAV